MGKPEVTEPVVKKRAPQKSPISKGWISTFYHLHKHAYTCFEDCPRIGNEVWGRGERKLVVKRNADLTCDSCSGFHTLRRPTLRGPETLLLRKKKLRRFYTARARTRRDSEGEVRGGTAGQRV